MWRNQDGWLGETEIHIRQRSRDGLRQKPLSCYPAPSLAVSSAFGCLFQKEPDRARGLMFLFTHELFCSASFAELGNKLSFTHACSPPVVTAGGGVWRPGLLGVLPSACTWWRQPEESLPARVPMQLCSLILPGILRSPEPGSLLPLLTACRVHFSGCAG